MVSDTLHPTALPGGGGNPVIEQVTGLPPVDVHDFSVAGVVALSAVKTAPLGRGPTVPFAARMPPASTAMLGSAAVVVSVGVDGAVVGVVVACGAAVLGVVGVVVVAVDGDAAGVGAAAGNGAAKDRVPIAKPVASVTQTRDLAALRPSLSRRRR